MISASFVLFFLFTQAGPPPESPFKTLSAQEASPILYIQVRTNACRRNATAVVVDLDKRLALTAWHTLAGAEAIQVAGAGDAVESNPLTPQKLLTAGQGAKAVAVYAEPWNDLALIRFDELPVKIAAISLAKDRPKPDSELCFDGNPFEKNMLWQRVAGKAGSAQAMKWQWPDGQRLDTRFLPGVAAGELGAGYSGGAVRNRAGDLVGLIVAGRDDTVYAVEGPVLRRFLERAKMMSVAVEFAGRGRANPQRETRR